MNARITRGDFLRAGAKALAAATALGSPLLRPEAAFGAPVRVRRDVGTLSASSRIIRSYERAVRAMKALPPSDPRSWSYQAAIHGTLTMPAQTAWNTCEHGSLYFWSWHRMYLYYFERIVRHFARDPQWTLPYWNYESPSQRELPAPFRDPASPLYTPSRGAGWNSGASSLPGWAVDTSAGMAALDYTIASGSLEGTPHGNVHVQIGGWMGWVPTAAQDPIFYLHHCNIDRLWNLWLAQGGGRSNPLGDAAWRTTPFTFFDRNRQQVQLTGCEVLRAAQQLDYRYQGEPAQVNQFCLRVPPWLFEREPLFRWPGPPFFLAAARRRVRADISRIRERLLTIARRRNESVLIRLDDVVAARRPNAVWQVFLTPPNVTRLDPNGPFFIGTVALFGAGVREGAREFKPATFTFVADRAVQTALRTGADELALTFVAAGPVRDGRPSRPRVAARVRVGEVTMLVQTRRRR
jgi:Common central domain of tyrosinase/Polyphenol oxidase middle domain